jgi:D-3-phosphoglycerate dehydrogenase
VTTPGKNANAVAELTVALMIMLGRRVAEGFGHVLAGGEVYRDNYEGGRWYGHELSSHTLGIIGFGQIGSRVASLASAFGMDTLAYDPFVGPAELAAGGTQPVADLDTLLARSDYISLHARATKENRGLLGAEQLGRMKRGAFLVNTARDSLVDEEALDEALRSGHLGGAALDVASGSSSGRRHRLLGTPNVVLLPHIGGATIETLDRGARMAVAEIERLAAGRPLANVANPSVLTGHITRPA